MDKEEDEVFCTTVATIHNLCQLAAELMFDSSCPCYLKSSGLMLTVDYDEKF